MEKLLLCQIRCVHELALRGVSFPGGTEPDIHLVEVVRVERLIDEAAAGGCGERVECDRVEHALEEVRGHALLRLGADCVR